MPVAFVTLRQVSTPVDEPCFTTLVNVTCDEYSLGKHIAEAKRRAIIMGLEEPIETVHVRVVSPLPPLTKPSPRGRSRR